MTLDELRDRLRAFAAERDWQQFHTPRNLAMALGGEVGELLALFQWETDEAVHAFAAAEDGTKAVGDELADILVYLVRLADVVGLDLAACVDRKIEANERRYRPDAVRGSAAKQPHT